MQIMHLTQVHYSNSNKVSKEWHCLANATINTQFNKPIVTHFFRLLQLNLLLRKSQ